MDENQNATPTQPEATGSSNKKWIIIGIVVLVVLVLLGQVLSPERIAERALENAMEGEYDVDIDADGSVTVKGGDGEDTVNMSSGEDVALDDSWPASIPIVRDAKIVYTTSSPTEDGTGMATMFSTSQSVIEVASFYTSELTQNGWTIETEQKTPGGTMFVASKNEDSVVVTISKDTSETFVNITAEIQN